MIHHVLTTNSLWHHMIKVEEISLLELQKAQMELDKYYRKLKFDFFDFAIHSLPLLGHTIWYFYIQSSCMNAERATPWNCYNAFGYRLFNYVFAPYCAFFWLVVTKIYVHHITRVEEKSQIIVPSKESNIVKIVWNKIEYHIGLWSSLLTVVVVGAPLVPYLYTNVIPMAGAYAFMGIIYILFWMCGLVFCVIVSYIPGVGRLILGIIKSLPRDDHPIAAVFLMFPFTLLTLPILLSVFFNYSQYLYYGNDYFTTMRDEFDSRDTQTYFKILQASVNERLHTSLDFI
ncbi:hypothetical protein I4U23_023256 [Adineta vaga]|nr:hypothetical protein I4U23_023256 [Adineta vaga]